MPLIMRWAHLGAAIASLGGLAFLVGAVFPGLRSADPEQAVLILRDLFRRAWAGLWTCAVVLIVSGVYAAAQVGAGARYHGVLGLKVVLGIAFLGVAAAGIRPSRASGGLSRRVADLLWLALLLGAATVLLSGYLEQIRSPHGP